MRGAAVFAALLATPPRGDAAPPSAPSRRARLVRPATARSPPRPVVPVGEMLSAEPRIFLHRALLSPAECDALIAAARRSGLRPSGVDGGGSSPDRLAESCPLEEDGPEADPVTVAAVRRIHAAAQMPLEHGEHLQVSRYAAGGFYELHYDSTASLGRLSTVLVYLNTLPEGSGGETVFPNSLPLDGGGRPEEPPARAPPFAPQRTSLSAVCPPPDNASWVWYRPRVGDALHFYNHRQDLTPDPLAVHAACPLLAAHGTEKWVAQRWIRQRPRPARR
eukprot:TRINITY_DN66951_c0_g1_i1.p1 TRINITY_DN66951_c0_g1~~TRINITY_DN66951_c0_g1_i1.p1  ORF type:complete len:299 (+),score=83.12 TRINITY_DN66951_c0_g1_i1:68-898(+)